MVTTRACRFTSASRRCFRLRLVAVADLAAAVGVDKAVAEDRVLRDEAVLTIRT